MADVRESFPVLETSTSAGVAITQAIPGNAASAITSTIAAPVFQDANGNLVFPKLTAGGAVAVDTDADVGTKAFLAASAAGSTTEVVVNTLTLTANKKIENIEFEVAARRGSLFRFTYNNNGTETPLGFYVTEAGQFSIAGQKNHVDLTASTGTQQLKMYGTNFDVVSNFYAYLACVQV